VRRESHDLSTVSRNAVLTATLSKCLRSFARTGDLDARGATAVTQGAELLQRILDGSALVQGRSAGHGALSPNAADRKAGSSEAFREYALALHAMVRSRSSLSDSTRLLRAYKDRLLTVRNGTRLPRAETEELVRFIRHLNSLFFAELHRPATFVYRDRL
jgi:hypothetical protein